MSLSQKVITTALYFSLLIGIGSADAFFTKENIQYPTQTNYASSLTGISPIAERDVFAIMTQKDIATTSATEESLIKRITPATEKVETRVLLQREDRVALFSYVESPKVKEYFNALKIAINASFSPDLQGLIDETTTPEEGPTFNILSFTDPAISEEQLVFLRVRQRLYEFHVAPGGERLVSEIVEELKK